MERPAASHMRPPQPAVRYALIAAGVASILASTCCVAPALLLTAGFSGDWIANLSVFGPYRPLFITASLAALMLAYGRIFRPAEGAVPRARRSYKVWFVIVAALTLLAVTLPLAPPRDAGRDVTPMGNPLTGGAPAVQEIIPLEKVRKSQPAAVSQRIANTEITVTYSRPVARGRALFGALVPYDQVWNPGADRATAIAFTRDVQINDRPLPAGKYSVWIIPRSVAWTVIFSKAADVYHTPYPGESEDALRLEVMPVAGPHMEVLTFYFPMVEGKDANLRLHWGEIMVPLSIRVM